MTADTLLTRINRFLRVNAMRPTRFGRMAINDPRLVGDLGRGRQLGDAVRARVEAFLDRGQA